MVICKDPLAPVSLEGAPAPHYYSAPFNPSSETGASIVPGPDSAPEGNILLLYDFVNRNNAARTTARMTTCSGGSEKGRTGPSTTLKSCSTTTAPAATTSRGSCPWRYSTPPSRWSCGGVIYNAARAQQMGSLWLWCAAMTASMVSVAVAQENWDFWCAEGSTEC